ncbi:MAG: GGDEF domain-containing protein [Rubrivivax sp.]
MNGGTDGLWISACATAVAALALMLNARRPTPRRGWRHWQLALWTASAGILWVAVAGPAPWAVTLGHLLLLPWPLLALLGMRRFHARIEWPGSTRLDLGVLLSAAAAVALAGLWPPDSIAGSVFLPTTLLLAHLYAASMLVCAGGSRPEMRPMLLLAGVVALAACAPMIAALPGVESRALFDATAAATALGSIALAFIVTTLAFDRNERQLRASRRRLRALASTDPLTQVPNRRHFEELAVQVLERDPPASAVLVLFDVDHFKRINDQYGHAAGDRALRLVSRCVREVLRVQDVPCRHGGDEFALLLRHASVADAMRVAARLVDRVQGLSLAAGLPTLSLSFGVVQVRPAELLGQALGRADQALYEAKRQGRSRVVAAGGSDQQPTFTESRPLGLTAA